MDEFLLRFVSDHADDDPARLLLSAERWPEVDVRHAAGIIAARRKIREKLPSWHACPEIDYPSTLALEQCSSEETALYKQAFVPAGGRIADLTGGLGVDCLALAAVASEAHYCERDPGLCAAARHNFPLLGAPDLIVHEGDGVAWMSQAPGHFDLVYLDPARRDRSGGRVYDIAGCEPNLLEIKDLLLSKAERVVAKISPMADIGRTLAQLPETRELHVVAAGGEVKELLLLMEGGNTDAPLIVAAEGPLRFCFRQEEETSAPVAFAASLRRYLYQPSKALLKAGAFRLLSYRCGLEKIAPSTHLYTSDRIVEDFPGKRFEVEEVIPWGKPAIRQLKESYPRLEMTALNFPLPTEALRTRIGIPDGGPHHLFATTSADRRKILVITRNDV